MKVRELIEHLKQFDQDLTVLYRCCSEWDGLEAEQVRVVTLQPQRADGWVHDFQAWRDKANVSDAVPYLVFPGN